MSLSFIDKFWHEESFTSELWASPTNCTMVQYPRAAFCLILHGLVWIERQAICASIAEYYYQNMHGFSCFVEDMALGHPQTAVKPIFK